MKRFKKAFLGLVLVLLTIASMTVNTFAVLDDDPIGKRMITNPNTVTATQKK